MAAKITISIPRDPTQGISVDVDGVKGTSCKKLTENLEAALGKVKHEELKPEYEMRAAEQEDYLTQ